MLITFVPSSLEDEDARPLIAGLNAHALSVYPNPDDHHWRFAHEEGLFVVAYVDGVPSGCCGVRDFGDGTAELKQCGCTNAAASARSRSTANTSTARRVTAWAGICRPATGQATSGAASGCGLGSCAS